MKSENTNIKSKGATVLLSMAIGVMTCKKNISFKNKKLGKTSCNSNKYYLQFYKIYEDDYSAKGSGGVKTE